MSSPPPPFPPQLDAARKLYHLTCKEEKLALTREANSKAEPAVAAEQQKKLHEKVDKCKQDSQKVRVPRTTPPHPPPAPHQALILLLLLYKK